MTIFSRLFAVCLCTFLAARTSAAMSDEAMRQTAESGLEMTLQAGALEAAPSFTAPVDQPAGLSGAAECYKAASPLTQYPPLLCAGAGSAAPADCFSAAKGLTGYPAMLCSGAVSNAPVACLNEVKGVTKNPDLLCSPNGVLKGVTHHNIDPSYRHPYPFPYPDPYPFWFPFPDPNVDPGQPPPTPTDQGKAEDANIVP